MLTKVFYLFWLIFKNKKCKLILKSVFIFLEAKRTLFIVHKYLYLGIILNKKTPKWTLSVAVDDHSPGAQ